MSPYFIKVDPKTRTAIIEGPDDIILRPDWGKEVRGKSGNALFEKNNNKGYKIPEGTKYVKFPHFRKYYGHIDYGTPVFLDGNGNEIGYN